MKEHPREWAIWDKVTLPRIFENGGLGEEENGSLRWSMTFGGFLGWHTVHCLWEREVEWANGKVKLGFSYSIGLI